jgi:hypothetical protein
MDVMRSWKLRPTNPSDPCWKGSRPRAEIVVSAENESEARRKAMLETLEFAPVVPGKKIDLYNPWQDANATTCEEVSAQTAKDQG